jgi:2-oxoglutarate ferredoxin oxidoreductase subunit alpha
MSSELSIVLCGAAGQGVQTVESLLVKALGRSGFHVFATKESMSRVRGGSNSTEIRIADKRVEAFVDRIDLLVPLNGGLRRNIWKRLGADTFVLGDREELRDEFEGHPCRFVNAPFLEIARQAGGPVTANSVAAGLVCALLGVHYSLLEELIRDRFGAKADILERNLLSAERGYLEGGQFIEKGLVRLGMPVKEPGRRPVIMDGHKAVSLGALAGGCNFVTAYPMSPGSGVLAFMAQNASRFGIAVEQVEDEISAVNMALGAWAAGARAMATTSGGGFALMEEGISLSAVTEIPLVIHLGQRPGPATGMATRTEQADLELALYAGHGEFPRVILSPGNAKEAFELSRLAFDWADRFQVPVFLLTDEYLLDSIFEEEELPVAPEGFKHHFVETGSDYLRYRLSENGVSPRGIFGYGTGLVRIDSHEHDESGHIEEDFEMREKMQLKRLSKLRLLEEVAVPPTVLGEPVGNPVVFCWGSTGPIVKEAIANLGKGDIALVHFRQVFPLHPMTHSLLAKAGKVVVVEGNSTGQLARLLRLSTGRKADHLLLNFKGHQFSVEEVTAGLDGLLAGGVAQ